MYKLSYFTEEDNEKVIEFMQRNSFAVIAGMNERYPVATHVPLDIKEVDGKLFFTGHIMKNTDHHDAFLKNENVLVIFNGPQCYVSASWYSKPQSASTWNYMTVHSRGKIKFGDEEFTKTLVENVTNKHEQPNSISAFNKLPDEYIDRLVKAIIGFKIEVENIENVFKLSQNQDEETRRSIIAHLKESGSENENKIVYSCSIIEEASFLLKFL